LGGVPPGGLWTGVGVSGGQFDPQVAGVGVWSAVYTYLNLFSDTLQIEVRGLTASTQTRVICVGDSVVVGSVSYNTTGIYTVQLTGSNGCDSVVTLNLTVLDSDTTNLDEVVCFGGSYTVGSSVYSTTGVHVTTLTGSLGCDSVVILNLTVLPQATSVVNDTICSSSAGVTIGTQTYSLAGTYTVTLLGASAAGCDSVVTLNLSVNPPLSLAFSLNGSAMSSVATGGSQSLCNNDDVLILLSGVGQGLAPVSGSVRVWLGGIGFSLNRTIQASGLQVGDTLYYAAAGTVPAGEYTVEVLSATDANGCTIDRGIGVSVQLCGERDECDDFE